ncbi:hypothetical protein GCM10010219_53410 [Streptomyces netropsis]|nr:hypothetical protein GCM10010219_53410 [Streptomyces netropsis]
MLTRYDHRDGPVRTGRNGPWGLSGPAGDGLRAGPAGTLISWGGWTVPGPRTDQSPGAEAGHRRSLRVMEAPPP